MRKNRRVWTLGILCVACMVLITTADFFDFFSRAGLSVAHFNLDFLSIVIGNGVVILLFIIAYALIDSRNIEKENNKRRTVLVILKNVYEHCIEMVELFSDDFTRKHAVSKCSMDEVAVNDKMHMVYRTLPFADNNDAILGFMQDGVLSKNETETYFEVKRKYASYIDLSIIYWTPTDHVSTKGLEESLLSMLRTALDEIEGELTHDNQ